MQYLDEGSLARRSYWIEEIRKLSGNFGNDSARLEAELTQEIGAKGQSALLDHVRTCGALPESYRHDSSEEKLYSKYTDCVIAEAFRHLGLKALVVKERADAADVEVVADDFSFVADAKAFRLSRTAKNQKDFKVEAMHSWKRAHKYAVVVCPLYQLPSRSSQIYLQSTARDVLILSYSHLAVLIRAAAEGESDRVVELIYAVFRVVSQISPSKDAVAYWIAINREFHRFGGIIEKVYQSEREALMETINIAKEEALNYLSAERKRIMQLSHQEAIAQLVVNYNFDSRMKTINSVGDNALFRVD